MPYVAEIYIGQKGVMHDAYINQDSMAVTTPLASV
jgi:hypothetical protein